MFHSIARWLAPLVAYLITAVAWSFANRSIGDPDYWLDGFGIATIFFIYSYLIVFALYKEADFEKKTSSAAASAAALPILGIAVAQAVLALTLATSPEKRTGRGLAAGTTPIFVFFLAFIVRRGLRKPPPIFRA